MTVGVTIGHCRRTYAAHSGYNILLAGYLDVKNEFALCQDLLFPYEQMYV